MGTVTINSVTINGQSFRGYGPFTNNNQIVSVDLQGVNWTTNSMRNAFTWCNNLHTVSNLPNTVVNLDYTFYWCRNLVNAPEIPNSVITMKDTFTNTNLVTTPVIPNSVTDMSYTFDQCHMLENILPLPSFLICMQRTFSYCENLVNAPIIPNSVTNMEQTFLGCSKLASVPIIPYSVKTLYDTFRGCSNLTGEAYIYSTDIGSAFNCFATSNLSRMINVYIPYNASLGIYTLTYNTFANAGYTPSTTKDGVTIKENPNFEKYGDWWYCNHDGVIHKYLGSSIPTNLAIPNSINGKSTSIYGYRLFYYDYGIINGNTMTKIDMNNVLLYGSLEYAFGWCQNANITNLRISDTVTNMSYAFIGCNNLTEIPTLPTQITDLSHAFEGCWNLPAPPNMINCKALRLMTMAFHATNLIGNFYIGSEQIISAESAFYFGSGVKNVYIPFRYANGEYTQTYNTMLNYGYTTTGTKHNVYLKDLATL